MILCAHQEEILNSVVIASHVDVMNFKALWNRAAEILFHDLAMRESCRTPRINQLVTFLIDVAFRHDHLIGHLRSDLNLTLLNLRFSK